MRTFLVLGLFICIALFPHGVSAHEVYVLSPETITYDLSISSPNPFSSFATNKFQFFFWGFLAFVLVTTVFFMSLTHRLEVFFDPYLTPLRKWAPLVARVILGVCLIACAWYGAIFGPELPLSTFGSSAPAISVILYVSGALIVCGVLNIPAALATLGIFALSLAQWGWYPLITYANYLGEILFLLLLAYNARRFEPYAFLILRVSFGVSLIGASVYAKFVHAQLALDVVNQYHLTQYFHFDPLFIVLGAGIIEFLAGLFIIIGFEIRHTALFLLFWLTLSLLYFQESVWPHLVLVGVLVALFMYGYDKWTVEGRLFNRGKLQPFL